MYVHRFADRSCTVLPTYRRRYSQEYSTCCNSFKTYTYSYNSTFLIYGIEYYSLSTCTVPILLEMWGNASRDPLQNLSTLCAVRAIIQDSYKSECILVYS